MKYKKHIATGVLAFSLLISGSNVFASTPKDIGIKNVQPTYQKQNKNNKNLKIKNTGKNNTVGTISAISNTGFTVNVKNMKTKITSSVDVKTDIGTGYSKNGINAKVSDLSTGQRVIVIGDLDKTTNILTAKTVKIVR
jgi:hypothetical protein